MLTAIYYLYKEIYTKLNSGEYNGECDGNEVFAIYFVVPSNQYNYHV
jgi:hypothetical protein